MAGQFTRREFLKHGAVAGAALSFAILPPRGAFAAALDPGAVRIFGSSLKGRLILPNDRDYDLARKVWNGNHDKHPAMVARCAGSDDVVRSVEFARKHKLAVSIRSGGHDAAGYSTNDGGMVIDISGMNGVQVDAEAATAQIEMGAQVGQLYQAAQIFRMAAVSGECPSVGVGGLTLGGGDGRLLAKYGLACDNMISAEVVTADGRVLMVQKGSNEDLFWAIRGGGGNFGVVTRMRCQLYPIEQVLGGALTYPVSQWYDVMHFYRDFIVSAPDELTTGLVFTTPRRKPVLAISVCYCGDLNHGEQVLKPLRSFARRATDTIKAMPFMQAATAEEGEWGIPSYSTGGFIPELSDDAIDVICEHAMKAPPMFEIGMDDYHGAVCRMESAFALRHKGFNMWIDSSWKTPKEAEASKAWVAAAWHDIAPFTHGVYVNALDDDGGPRAKDAYGANYGRLATIKKKYDPSNFFHMNQNIKPA